MNLSLLQTFVLVAEARSFTAVAKRLGAPTSSISRSITRLEGELGSKLFERTTRRTALTAAGRAYYEHARRALTELSEGEQRVAEVMGQPRGEVRLTIPIHLDGGFLANELVSFAQLYPQVRIMVVPTNRRMDVTEESFDLALRVQLEAEDATLALRELGRFHAWLVASPRYLEQHDAPHRPRDLTKHHCINLQSYRFPLRLLGPRGNEVVDVSGPLIANDMHFARQLVEAGAGIGPLIFAPGERPALGAGLVRVLPDYVVEGPRLFLGMPSRKSMPLRVRLLRDFLVEAYERRSRNPEQ